MKEQENTLMVVLGVVGLPLTTRVLYEWAPGDRFATTMAVIMVVWTLFYTTWVIQWARQHHDREEPDAVFWPTAPMTRPLVRTADGLPTPAAPGEDLGRLERMHG